MDARGMILRNRRLAWGWTLKDVAGASGVRVSTISRLEAGKMPNASLDTWFKVCEALGIDIKELVEPRVPELV